MRRRFAPFFAVSLLLSTAASAQLSSLSNPSTSSGPDATKANLSGGNTWTGTQLYSGGGTLQLQDVAQSSNWLLYNSGGNVNLFTNQAVDFIFSSAGVERARISTAGALTATSTISGSNLLTSGLPASIATGTIIGRSTAGTGAASALTVLPTAVMPAFTGDVTTSAGSLTTALSSATVVSKVSAQALAPASIAATGAVTSSGATAGVGYATGAGGTVTQITSRTTGVTLNKLCGAVTLFSVAGSATASSFTVTDSAVAATDVVVVVQKAGADKYLTYVTNMAAGSFQITSQTTGGTTVEAPVFQFCVVKGVNA